jgi:hypothetical protein
MMKNNIIFHLFFVLVLIVLSCSKTPIDDKKPEIDLSIQGAFPLNCDTLYFGEPFTFKVLFSDNAELGSYSIDIHHNFDHHSHSTEISNCEMDAKKSPVNPFVLIEEHDIPQGTKQFETSLEITIPDGNFIGQFDEGEYHLFVSLTDNEGWSAQKGLNIKIKYR